MLIRFSLLFRGNVANRLSCTITYEHKLNELIELWSKCSDMNEFLNSLNSLASFGTVYSIGTLRGDVYRLLPSSMYDLINSLNYDMVLEPGVPIQCQVLRDLSNNLILLARYSSKISLKVGKRIVEAYLVKPLYLSTLFDSGIRLLKPYERPPRLI